MNPLSWPTPVLGASCGFLAIAVVWLLRVLRFQSYRLSLPTLLMVFIAGGAVPSGIVFCLYPFVNPRPDLEQHILYVPVAGIATLWLVGASIRQGLDRGDEEAGIRRT